MKTFLIDQIYRQANFDYLLLFGSRLALISRPIHLWKRFYWGYWGANEIRCWAIQSPWLTIVARKVDAN